jgi:YfiH family protein
MPLAQAGALRVFRFATLPENEVIHGVLSRNGGVSPSPWHSLNVGGNIGDAPERVAENRRRAFQALGLDPAEAFDVWQVHSADVVVVQGARHGGTLIQADGMVTDRPGLTLFMRFADCVPILAYDPERNAIGIAHAGWLGTVRQAARALVRTMVQAFGTRPESLLAGLGPSIGAHHYPVGPDVISQFGASLGTSASDHLSTVDGRTHLDLWSASRALLMEEGVRSVEVSGVCTACDLGNWYSHRGEDGRTGRLAAMVSLRA